MATKKKQRNSVDPSVSLEFDIACFLQEIENMRKAAKRFLDVRSFEYVIQTWRDNLVNIRDSGSLYRQTWAIPITAPITTIPSKGCYEPTGRGRGGGLSVYGTVSAVWEIRLNSVRAPKTFAVVGNASTSVSVIEATQGGTQKPLITWNFDIGDYGAPGCCFHVGVPTAELPIPRLPSILTTPMDALAFLLGELFQTEWAQEVLQESEPMRFWSQHQQKRMASLLSWHSQELRNPDGLAWAHLKRQFPKEQIFTNQ